MRKLSTACFIAAFVLLTWAAKAIVFNPPMLLTTTSNGVITVQDLGQLYAGGGQFATLTVGAGGIPGGSTLVAIVNGVNGPGVAGSVRDSVNGVWPTSAFQNISGTYCGIWIKQNATAIPAGGTITWNVSSGQLMISAIALQGVKAASLDLTTAALANSATPTITSGTPSQSGEMFVGGMCFQAVSSVPTVTQAAGWSSAPDATPIGGGQSFGLFGGNKINAGSSPVTYNSTLSVSHPWGLFLYSFKS